MPQTIDAIMAAVQAIEQGITAPTGQPAPQWLPTPPVNPVTAPSLFNLEDDSDYETERCFGQNNGPVAHHIGVYLVLPATDLDNRFAFRRVWEPVIAAAFETDTTKLGGACEAAFLGKAAWITSVYAGVPFLALRFPLTVYAERA